MDALEMSSLQRQQQARMRVVQSIQEERTRRQDVRCQPGQLAQRQGVVCGRRKVQRDACTPSPRHEVVTLVVALSCNVKALHRVVGNQDKVEGRPYFHKYCFVFFKKGSC